MSYRRPLLLWSGGLDSTYQAYLLADKGVDFDHVYIDCGQGHDKCVAEKRTLMEMQAWFEIRFAKHRRRELLPHSKILFGNTPAPSFRQPIAWLVAALEVVDPEKHNEVIISYVAGDQVLSAIPDLQAAWEHLWKFTKRGEVIPLNFPLRFTRKSVILEHIPPDLYHLTWVCEIPQTVYRPATDDNIHLPCDRCDACIARKTELYRQSITPGRFSMPLDKWSELRLTYLSVQQQAELKEST